MRCGRAHDRRAGRVTAGRAARDPVRARRGGHRGRDRRRLAGPRSTTSTSTTPAATSPPRTEANDGRPPHLVHDRPPGAQPDARADLDRAPARAADGLAGALRPAVQERHAARRLRHDVVHHVPRAGDRRHERVLRRHLERDVDDRRPRPQGRRAVPGDAGLTASHSCSRRSSARRSPRRSRR